MNEATITRQLVPEGQRLSVTAYLFGAYFPMRLEPAIYNITDQLAPAYTGAYWDFFTLSNEGFYMAPDGGGSYGVVSPNGFEGTLSADALGIVACLYAYSNLSFSAPTATALILAEHYHWLREWMIEGHPEAGAILRAID